MDVWGSNLGERVLWTLGRADTGDGDRLKKKKKSRPSELQILFYPGRRSPKELENVTIAVKARPMDGDRAR
jgi:hypothetical protein